MARAAAAAAVGAGGNLCAVRDAAVKNRAVVAISSGPSSRCSKVSSLRLGAGSGFAFCKKSFVRGDGVHRVGGAGRSSFLLRGCAIRALSAKSDDQNGAANEAPVNGKPAHEGALILIRHGESLWNQKNLFTGCVDVPLSQQGVSEAIEAGKRIQDIPVDIIFTSALIRAQMTAMLAMTQHRKKKVPTVLHQESDRAKLWSKVFSDKTKEEIIPVITAWELNERMYGELQGLNKQETAEKYGNDQVKAWRRSYDIPPPNGESLAMCAERAVAYFKKFVEPELNAGKNVLMSAHGNSLRSVIMYLDKLTSQEVIELELSTGIPMLYGFRDGKFIRRGSPVGREAYGVYALTHDLAAYRSELDSLTGTEIDSLTG